MQKDLFIFCGMITSIIASFQQKGQGVPGREPVFTEEDKKQMMSYAYKKQEEMKVNPSKVHPFLPQHISYFLLST